MRKPGCGLTFKTRVMLTPGQPHHRLSGAHHVIEQDADGNWHVYRKGTRTADDRLSEGIDDPRPSQLREQLAKITAQTRNFGPPAKEYPTNDTLANYGRRTQRQQACVWNWRSFDDLLRYRDEQRALMTQG